MSPPAVCVQLDLDGLLEFLDLRELQDAITSEVTWPTFAHIFHSRENLAGRFNQLAELRNAIRHTRTVSKIARKDGETSLLWFEQTLDEAIAIADLVPADDQHPADGQPSSQSRSCGRPDSEQRLRRIYVTNIRSPFVCGRHSIAEVPPPYPLFREALAGGNLRQATRLAKQLPTISLADAAKLLALMANDEHTDPELFERGALRWLTRFVTEVRGGTPAQRCAPSTNWTRTPPRWQPS